jgi:hypothetical protein
MVQSLNTGAAGREGCCDAGDEVRRGDGGDLEGIEMRGKSRRD